MQHQLANEYENVFISTSPNLAVQDFESHRPDVLVLAFNTLEKAERYYLGLYRLSSLVLTHPHRTVILCNKDEVKRVYELCKKDYFDDYILFWPPTHDFTRLAMAVYHAMHHLNVLKTAPYAEELTAQARKLAGLEYMLDWNVTVGNTHAEAAGKAMSQVEQEVNALLDSFTQRLTQGDLTQFVELKDANGLQHEMGRIQQEEIRERFKAVADAIIPLKIWAQEFKQQCAPYLKSVQALTAMTEKIPATILVVDDDELIHELFKTILAQENYKLIFAFSGIEAIKLLRKQHPDLILMDMMMPDIDGIETIRRIKKHLFTIPIIMITSNSEKSVVTECLKVGATDFVVKPFNYEILLEKIHKILLA